MSDSDVLADRVIEAKFSFEAALGKSGRFPTAEFQALFAAVRSYAEATEGDALMRDADRMECMLLGGWDPHFEGLEPPGL